MALLGGLVVLWIATPLLVGLGLGGSVPGLLLAVGYAALASVLPYLAARLVLWRAGWAGQTAQILAGIGVAGLSVALLNLAFEGALTPFLSGLRAVLGIALAGAVGGFIHHAILPAERQAK